MKKIISVLAVVSLLVLLLCPAAAAAPQVPPKPSHFDYVHDYAGILNQQDIAKMSSLGRELDEKTKAQVVVVTVDSLGNSTIEDYANTLFRSWGLGDKEKNNGVLLLINKENMLTMQPGKLRIEVGYGLEGAIPDGKAGRIRDEYIFPRWQLQKYSEGVLQGYMAAAGEVAKEYNITLSGGYEPVPLNNGDQQVSPAIIGLIVAIAGLSVFGALSRRRRRGWDDDDHGGFGGWGGGGFFGGGGFGGGGGGGGFGGGFGGGSSGGGGASG